MRGDIVSQREMLAIPAREISDLTQVSPNPLVSVLVLTYNHEAYIEDTIQGILAQQCDFPIEIIIGDDESRDRTIDICLEYQKKFPNIVRIITWEKNVGCNANFLRLWGRARGKYVAICEGDDYWIDPSKLSKQVVKMVQFPDTIICGAHYSILSFDHIKEINIKFQYCIEELLIGHYFHTSTFLIHRAMMEIPACARKVFNLDFVLLVAGALQGSIRCIPDTTSVYRIHDGGIYSGIDNIRKFTHDLITYQAILTFIDERYFPIVRKRIDIKNSCLCHAMVSNGQLSQARRLALETILPLASHSPLKTMTLLSHVFFPRAYRIFSEIWRQRKQISD
jgi:glycosyltransferase involved in cell wall biosynthesis